MQKKGLHLLTAVELINPY